MKHLSVATFLLVLSRVASVIMAIRIMPDDSKNTLVRAGTIPLMQWSNSPQSLPTHQNSTTIKSFKAIGPSPSTESPSTSDIEPASISNNRTKRAVAYPETRLSIIYCVAVIPQPTFQVRIFPDVSQCGFNGYIQLLTFIDLIDTNVDLAYIPWTFCENVSGPEIKVVYRTRSHCDDMDEWGSGWYAAARGYKYLQDTGQNTYISHSDHPHMIMNLRSPWDVQNYVHQFPLYHLAVFDAPFPAERQSAWDYVMKYPGGVLSFGDLRGAQELTLHLPTLDPGENNKYQVNRQGENRILPEESVRAKVFNREGSNKVKPLDFRYQLIPGDKWADGVPRMWYYLHRYGGRTPCPVVELHMPTDMVLTYMYVRAVFTESLRAHRAMHMKWSNAGSAYLIFSQKDGNPDLVDVHAIRDPKL